MSSKQSSSLPATRSKTEVWLVGQLKNELPINVLPTVLDVMKTFLYHHKILKKTIPESAKLTTDELIEIWNKARIPTTYHPHIVSKLKKLFDEYSLIKKNKRRSSETQHSRESSFVDSMNKLFDIAHEDVESVLKIEEDRMFLEDQRSCRKMKMSGIDIALTQKEHRSQLRKEADNERRGREKMRKIDSDSLLARQQVNSSDTDKSDAEEQDVDYEIEIPLYYKKQLTESEGTSTSSAACSKQSTIVNKILSSSDVASTVDRINLSDRKFTILAAAIARASGEDLTDVSLSRSTIQRKRVQHRAVTEKHIREEFHSQEKPPLLVHWDSKSVKDSTKLEVGKSNIERLAVVVTGKDVDKVLGVIKIARSTGQAEATATFQLLKLWDVTSSIVGMSFDTTASNTGQCKGACVLLEKQLQKNLLHFACRHHVHEIIISSVFTVLFGPSCGPNIPLFERFSKFWPNIDINNFKALDDARLNIPLLQQLRDSTGQHLSNFLSAQNSYLPREDYREVIELCLLILGYSVPNTTGGQYHFRAPGAYHMARWMAKVIYCMKICLFRDQLNLSDSERRNVTEFCLFAAHIYVLAWITCPVASDAPINDLQLFNQIQQYAEINTLVSESAMKKFKNHLWYLGAEMVPLSLFSNKVPNTQKSLIVEAMLNTVNSGNEWCERGIKYPCADYEQLQSKHLQDLVTSSSSAALRQLGLDVIALSGIDPEGWNDIPLFQYTAQVVKSLKVVNDCAERSIALMSAFNESITRKESEMQKLIQIVEDNRKRIPNSSKCTLASYTLRI